VEPKSIVCIEDDRETAALIAEELAERDFTVLTTYDGQEGFIALLKEAFAVIKPKLQEIGITIGDTEED
jgi:DNA-binding response OmpR family regulator